MSASEDAPYVGEQSERTHLWRDHYSTSHSAKFSFIIFPSDDHTRGVYKSHEFETVHWSIRGPAMEDSPTGPCFLNSFHRIGSRE